MKKLLLLFLLLIPIYPKAETIYTMYEPYLIDQTDRISQTDLISEKINTKYKHEIETIKCEGYFYMNNIPPEINKINEKDITIITRREQANYSQDAYNASIYNVSENNTTNEITLFDYNGEINVKVFDYNNIPIDYQLDNNKIIFDQYMCLDDIYFIFFTDNTQAFTVKINDAYYYVSFSTSINEIEFTSQINNRLNYLGIYSGYAFPRWDFYVVYSLQYKMYEVDTSYIINNNPNESIETITKYDYYKRDKIVFNDLLVLDKKNQDVLKYIKSTTIPKNEIKYESNIDYDTNGTYLVRFQIDDLFVTKYVVVLNDIVDSQKTCPVCPNQEENSSVINSEPIICDTKEVISLVPVYNEKETISYQLVYKDCSSSNIIYNHKVCKTSVYLYISIFCFMLLSFLLLIKRKR